MEETRKYPLDEDDSWVVKDDDRNLELAKREDELSFDIPRD